MKKRVLAGVLWFYAGWGMGSAFAFLFGLSPVLGPILAVACAALVAGDPLHVIWTAPTPKMRERLEAITQS